ncbi:MAG: prefoldin subunit beta [Candidatus Altiarchaeota archaeon]
MDVPKQVQDKLAQFQTLQNQVQMLSMQKQQLMLQNTDLDNAKKELESLTQGKVYRMVGPILIETGKDAGMKYVTDEHDMADAKIKVLEKQEKKLVEKLNEMQAELRTMLSPPKPG